MTKFKKAYNLKIAVAFLIGVLFSYTVAYGNSPDLLRGQLMGSSVDNRQRLAGGWYAIAVNSLLDREGITSDLKHSFSEMTDSSVKLFRFILAEEDPRRRIAANYLSIAGHHKGLTFENALLANYCSNYPSMRFRYSQYWDMYGLTQLARAIKNIEIGNKMPLTEKENNGYIFKYRRTDRINKGKNRDNITGCPEAIWQLQLFKDNQYLGRIGFNFHEEFGKIIVSICNIQGAEDTKTELDEFAEVFSRLFGIELVEMVKKDMPLLFPDKEIIFRGSQALSNGEANSVIYKMTFRRTKIPYYKSGRRMVKEELNIKDRKDKHKTTEPLTEIHLPIKSCL